MQPTEVGPGALPTVFVYDCYPGRAGFAEHRFRQARTWLGVALLMVKLLRRSLVRAA